MPDARSVLRFLNQSRARLNLIVTGAKFLTWFAGTGSVSGVIMLSLQWSGLFPVRIGVWFLISLIGGLSGLITGWRRRLDNWAAASWLDEHLNNGELLSAALVCLERDCSGCFDQRILDSAKDFSIKPNHIKWPLRFLVRQASIVAAVILICVAGSVYLTPFLHNPNYFFSKGRGTKEPTETFSRQNSQRLVVESPRTLAKLLFPDDANKAMLAERAFREGNLEVLQDLMKDAGLNMERLMAEAASPEEQRRLKNEMEQRQQIMEALMAGLQQETKTNLAAKEGEDSASQLTSTGNRRERQKRDNHLTQGRGSTKEQFDPGEMKTNQPYPPGFAPGGGNKAGSGNNPDQVNWGKIAARTGKEETIISQNKDSQLLEYILPGENARLPLTQVIPGAERSAEAAIHRQGIPYEYEDFVRNYFILLAQESKEVALKEAQK